MKAVVGDDENKSTPPHSEDPLDDTSREALAVAGASTLTILLYVLIVSNVYPQDVLRIGYENQCSKLAYFDGGAIVFQHQSRLEDYLRHAPVSRESPIHATRLISLKPSDALSCPAVWRCAPSAAGSPTPTYKSQRF